MNEIIINGKSTNLDTGRRKSINYIPGWVEASTSKGIDLAGLYQKSTWASRCIQIRSNALSSIEWNITRDGEVLEEHALKSLLEEVNPEMNWNDLIRATESDLLIFGRAYWLKLRPEGLGIVLNLERLNPSTMKINTNKTGEVFFERTVNGEVTAYPREEIVYFKEYHPTDDLNGLSCTAIARRAIEAEINTERYISSFFENYAVPALLLSTEQEVSEQEMNKVKRWWNNLFQGVNKQHKTGFVDKGLKPHVVSSPPGDLALKDIRDEARRSICAVYGVPPAIAGAWEAANYATSKEQRLSLYTEAVFPRAEYMQGVINAELAIEFDEEVKFEWDFSTLPIMQADSNLEAERIINLVRAGIITVETAGQELGYQSEELGSGPVAFREVELQEAETETPARAIFIPEEKENDIEAELNKFKRKALKRLKESKKASCSFQSDLLDESFIEAINAQLEEAEKPEEVVSIFRNALIWRNYP